MITKMYILSFYIYYEIIRIVNLISTIFFLVFFIDSTHVNCGLIQFKIYDKIKNISPDNLDRNSQASLNHFV